MGRFGDHSYFGWSAHVYVCVCVCVCVFVLGGWGMFFHTHPHYTHPQPLRTFPGNSRPWGARRTDSIHSKSSGDGWLKVSEVAQDRPEVTQGNQSHIRAGLLSWAVDLSPCSPFSWPLCLTTVCYWRVLLSLADLTFQMLRNFPALLFICGSLVLD